MLAHFVLDADLVESLDYVGLDANGHVFAALHQQGLVDQVAQGVLLTILDVGAQLLRCALPLAFLLGIVFSGGPGLVELRACNDFIIYACDDLLDHLCVGALGRLLDRCRCGCRTRLL
jgi:hypothetical protein